MNNINDASLGGKLLLYIFFHNISHSGMDKNIHSIQLTGSERHVRFLEQNIPLH